MQKFTFDRRQTELFSDQQNLLAYDQERLRSFIGRTFTLDNVQKQIGDKSKEFSASKRELLVSELRKQYGDLPALAKVEDNISALLNANTFTVTTGHQLSLFTGPVFFVYKILHVIRLCEELAKEFKEFQFVPVFWMASEDHDLEEVRSVDIFGKSLFWETDQEGAVGRMDTEGMEELKSVVRGFFQGKENIDVDQILDAYSGGTQSQALFHLVHELFGNFGLVCLDGDNQELKKSFIPIMEKELKEAFAHKEVEAISREVAREGFKVQVKSREVNLFYLNGLKRDRILKEEAGFYLKEEGVQSLEAVIELMHQQPDLFSPNVVLRPLYQEYILPNLCYVGGVGELSYWLQLKGVFEEASITYPLIHARTSILYLDANSSRKMEKANLQLEDFFQDKEALKRSKLLEQSGNELDLSQVESSMNGLKQGLYEKIVSADPGLQKYAEAELVKLDKQLDAIRDKLTRSLKQRHEVQMNTIDQLFDKLFPNGILQERVLNIFGMCPDGKIHDRISQLYNLIDPLDPDLVLLLD